MQMENSINSRFIALLCIDDLVAAMELRKALAREDVLCHIAQSRQQVQSIMAKVEVDMVAVAHDFAEPEFGFCQVLKHELNMQHLPVLALTKDDSAQSASAAYQQGANDFSSLTSSLDLVVQRVLQMLRSHRSRVQRENQARMMNRFDPVTGLFNRQAFTQLLEHSLQRCEQEDKLGAVVLIDIDNFKRINSSFSYGAGDKLLQMIGQRLVANLRSEDPLMRINQTGAETAKQGVARLGGDEFTLFIEGVRTVRNAVDIVRRLIACISEPLYLDGQAIVLTPSVGIAIYPSDGANVDTMLKNAEQAMYSAKEMGGASYKFYKGEMNAIAEARFKMESALRDAIVNDQLQLHYQPQVDTETGDVLSMEVLCRWMHPELGMVPPDTFIPLAEETGLIVDIGDWVMRTACQQAKTWLERGLNIRRIAVNVSAYQFHRQDFVKKTLDTLRQCGLSASHLEIELTESIIMSDVDDNIAKLNRLKKTGISLAVDDFGTGYSSLSYLKRLPIDTLKIDRSFIANIANEETDSAIVGAILALADKLHLNVVAEGVEDQEQMQFLRSNRCNLLQGYYFSAALPAIEAEQFLGKQKQWAQSA